MAILRKRKDMTAPVLLRHSNINDRFWLNWLRCSNGIPVRGRSLPPLDGPEKHAWTFCYFAFQEKLSFKILLTNLSIGSTHTIPHSVLTMFSTFDQQKGYSKVFCELHFLSIEHELNKFPIQKRSCDFRATFRRSLVRCAQLMPQPADKKQRHSTSTTRETWR